MPVELTPMKMLQVVIPGDRLEAVRELLALAQVGGYTVVPNVSGMGHHGYHEGRLLFNELNSQVMIVAVVTADRVDTIVTGLEELFGRMYVIERARFDTASRAHPLVGVKMFARLARTLALRLRRADVDLRAFYET